LIFLFQQVRGGNYGKCGRICRYQKKEILIKKIDRYASWIYTKIKGSQRMKKSVLILTSSALRIALNEVILKYIKTII